MSKEKARARTKEIEIEQNKLGRIWLPSQLMLLLALSANMISGKELIPEYLTNDYVINSLMLFAFVGISWASIKSWKLNRERNAILGKYGIW